MNIHKIGWKLKDGKQYINKKEIGIDYTNKIQDK